MRLPLKIKGLDALVGKFKRGKGTDAEADADTDGQEDDLDELDDADDRRHARRAPADDLDDRDADDEESDVGEGGAGAPGDADKRRRFLIIGGAGGVGLLAVAGIVAWLFTGGDGHGPGGLTGIPWVGLQMPPSSIPPGDVPKPGEAPPGKDAKTKTKAGEKHPKAPVEGPAAGVVVAATDAAAFRHIPLPAMVHPLAAVPDQALVEQGSYGPLPRVGADGRKAWKAYARPFHGDDGRPRVALIVTGLGLSRAATEAAIKRLPGAVTLAFDPYATGLDDWVPLARRAGHEFLLSLPMESVHFPIEDAGPYALRASLATPDNMRRLDFLLSRLSGYVGVIGTMGSKFDNAAERLRPILQALEKRGLMFVAPAVDPAALAPRMAGDLGLPRVVVDLTLDADLSRAALDARLANLEAIGRDRGMAVATVAPYPSALERVAAWAATLADRGLTLVPVTAIVDKQTIR